MDDYDDDIVGTRFILASILAAYPLNQFHSHIDNLRWALETMSESCLPLASSDELRTQLDLITTGKRDVDEVRSEYIDLFDRGRQENSLYETEYGKARSVVKGSDLVDIAGFYNAFGFECAGEGGFAEMVDHIAVEMEFYALLILKEKSLSHLKDHNGMETVRAARTAFMRDHLGCFIDALNMRPGVVKSPFYKAVFGFCREIIANECRRFQLDVRPSGWLYSASPLESEMSCGVSGECSA